MLRENGHPVVAALLDVVMAPLDRQRRKVVPEARGGVLEVGSGTGLNAAHYGDQVTRLVALEPDPHMRARAADRFADVAFEVGTCAASAEALPFEDGTFDDVVATWVFCTIPHPERALAEVLRVLRPGGRMLFAEHVVAEARPVAWLQGLVTPAWRQVAGGCHLDRDTIGLLKRVGFDTVEVHRPRGARWSPVPSWRGVATKAAGSTGAPGNQDS